MSGLNVIEALAREGRFIEALRSLTGARSSVTREERAGYRVLEAYLLERTGNYLEGQSLCQQLLANQTLTKVQRSVCETTLGIIKTHYRHSDSAISHFQRAVSLAQSAKDLKQSCWSQLRLMLAVAEFTGPQSAVPIFTQVRTDVLKLGDPHVSAALHLFLGEVDAKRGMLKSAERHAALGQQLLGDEPNLWLQAYAENLLVCITVMRSDPVEGFERARRGLQFAEQGGCAALKRACLGNLGNICYLQGKFGEAADYFKLADGEASIDGEISSAALDSLAKAALCESDLTQAAKYLERLSGRIKTPADRLLHANRCSHLTKIELLDRLGDLTGAIDESSQAIDIATLAGDELLIALSKILKAELLGRTGQKTESLSMLAAIACDLPRDSIDVQAPYERAVACSLAAAGDQESGHLHLERARRIYRGVQNVPGLLDLERAWTASMELDAGSGSSDNKKQSSRHGNPRDVANVIQNIATLMIHAGRPDLIATGLVAILADSGSVSSALAISRTVDGATDTLASFDASPRAAAADEPPERTIQIGSARNRSIDVTFRPLRDIESVATLNAITLLLATVRDLERARAEREERETLWPIDEIPEDDDQAVLTGKMRELMTSARKVAAIRVSVLITGESGTGKEILANAIHRHSTRAAKPFVPFNCTAIPREMLESQLFGHRRGAFTGADRDSLGLIRSAQGGTLFLDEIGELGLDLQPKLLRFLESGEICPLGEPGPLHVDVRIIAATNSNLEQLVQQGRFREDLFYRLNVIRLAIPPLRERRDEIPALAHHFAARASAEFSKGRVRITEETMEHLVLYPWPGNVRQLFNEIRRMVALADADAVLRPSALSLQILRATPRVRKVDGPELAVPLQDKLTPTLWRIEREMIRAALHKHNGQLEAAAKSLGISRKGLYLKRQRLKI